MSENRLARAASSMSIARFSAVDAWAQPAPNALLQNFAVSSVRIQSKQRSKKIILRILRKNQYLTSRSRPLRAELFVPPPDQLRVQKSNASKTDRMTSSARVTNLSFPSSADNILSLLWFCCRARMRDEKRL
jgi:hypothetical protein